MNKMCLERRHLGLVEEKEYVGSCREMEEMGRRRNTLRLCSLARLAKLK
jgi:cobyrinic acid a,c-diamide synthase